jgi:hypothetical protein
LVAIYLTPLVTRLGLVRWADTSQARFFCVNNGPGFCQFEFYCQYNRLLKAVMEIFGAVFAKITQYPKVRTVHLDDGLKKI